ncbi:MAG: DUF4956 domain-containing protein, partial [Prevotella histicola]|uniref:DUF4956 domain-containing protein n=1 Tax=Prevotella histicola TaxID=470565 RepID=UPI00241F7E6D
FTISLVILPGLIQVVIMMVNGNLGTSVAALGAFSLVRFRSVPGNSKEICSVFFSMAIGLATGMGYITFAVLITIIIGLVLLILFKTSFGEKSLHSKELKITIPENLDYTEIFEDIFSNFASRISLERVKTTNLGSMYELQYSIVFKNDKLEKEFIDEIRCRNGNLPVICGRPQLRDEL